MHPPLSGSGIRPEPVGVDDRDGQVVLIAMRRSNYLTLWELVLLLASILVFRSGWLLLDRLAWATSVTGLFSCLAIGFLVCVVSIKAINRE